MQPLILLVYDIRQQTNIEINLLRVRNRFQFSGKRVKIKPTDLTLGTRKFTINIFEVIMKALTEKKRLA